MRNKTGMCLSPVWFLLDGIGSILLVIGIMEWINEDGFIIPQAWRSENYALILILLGGFLAILSMAKIIAQLKACRESQDTTK